MINPLLDSLLDRAVVPGYTKIGYRLRSRGWGADEPWDMHGKAVLVTGATSGLGLAAAEGFARLGATVTLVSRSAGRGERARDEIRAETGNEVVRAETCDISDLQAVRKLAERLNDRAPRLDVLVHNAGVMTRTRERSHAGLELTFATSVLGPFLLTGLLAPLLERSAPARIVNVSSGGMYTQKLDVDDLQSERGEFDGPAAYARCKRAQVVLSELWAQRLAGTGVIVNSMHPGWADTPGLRDSLPRFRRLTRPLLRTPAQGADTIVWLGASPQASAVSGGFWHDRRQRPTNFVPWTKEPAPERERLWALCTDLSGLPDALRETAGRG